MKRSSTIVKFLNNWKNDGDEKSKSSAFKSIAASCVSTPLDLVDWVSKNEFKDRGEFVKLLLNNPCADEFSYTTHTDLAKVLKSEDEAFIVPWKHKLPVAEPTRPWIYREDVERIDLGDGNRNYAFNEESGERKILTYPSISTLNNHINPFNPFFWIKKIKKDNPDFEEDEVLNFMEEARNSGARRGTATHTAIEDFTETGKRPGVEDLSYPYFTSIESFIEHRVDHFIALEPLVWVDLEPQLQRAGAGAMGYLDGFAQTDGKNFSLIDWKTADKPKQKGHILNYFMQVSMYCVMLRATYGYKVDNAFIVVGVPDREAQVFELGPEDIRENVRTFLHGARGYFSK